MRVIVLTNNFSGLYSFRKEVVETLVKKDNEVIVSAPFDDRTRDISQLGCKVMNISFNRKGMNPVKDIKLMLQYKRLIKDIKPDVVLSYTIKPNLYGGMACRMCEVPQIANITGLGQAVENPGWLQKLTIFLYKIGLRKTKTVFFQNRANMDFCLQHGMVKGDCKLIPGSGVNLQYHKCQPYPAENPLKFIFISRLLREKGIEEYFGAAERIKAKHPDTEFHIVGPCEDAYEKQLERLQNEGVIIYHGLQKDVRPFIAECHCLVHPSFYPEGMSNVLLESCAAGRPVITTNRPGCGEIVDDTRTGFIVKAQDVDDLTRVMEGFIALPYEQKAQMGKAARAKVEKEFDRQIVVNAYMEEIANV